MVGVGFLPAPTHPLTRSIMNWDKPYLNNVTYTPFNKVLFDNLELSGMTALDIGCGTGQLADLLDNTYTWVTGIDLSPVAIGQAKKNYPGVYFEVADYLNADGEFDLITAKLVVAFVNLEQFFTKVKSLLNPGGLVLIQTPVTYPGYKYDDKYKSISVDYSKLMTEVLKAGFSIRSTNLSYQGDVGCLLTICIRKEPV